MYTLENKGILHTRAKESILYTQEKNVLETQTDSSLSPSILGREW